MLYTMVELVFIHSCIITRPLPCFLYGRKHNKKLAQNSEIKHAFDPPSALPNEIKLKKGTLFATIFLDAKYYLTEEPYHTMICTHVPYSSDMLHSALHPSITNLLQKFDGGMESRSRTKLIQEGEDDQDIPMLDTHKPSS